MTPPMERIQILETIEKDIIVCLQSAGQAFMELSKEKSSLKQAEAQTQQFLKTLGHVESKLSEQINYLTQVSTGKPRISIMRTDYYNFLVCSFLLHSFRTTARRLWICEPKGSANGMAQVGTRSK
ncbi:mediator complex subunit 11 isoform X1 [Ptiloglossa arizonensis]|uniref:mediator complex subunit 11 isoform X1 n=1 Tax=Ptiloglossa arizonensis TaxID=3350558 RepID=UPI003F9F68D1